MGRRDVYVNHIGGAVRAIDEFLSGVTEETFSTMPVVRDNVRRNLDVSGVR